MIGANNEISVYAMVENIDGHETYNSTPFITGEPCYIEPVDAQVATILDDQNAFKMFNIFCEGQLAINEGHKVVDLQSREYIVKGVEKFWNNSDTGDMTQLMCVNRFPS